jgi:glycosyltransferase involved in cell wall biosynthesis
MVSGRRILMLTADADIDRRILLQAETLTDAGSQVTILAPARGAGSVAADPCHVRRVAPREAGAATFAVALRAYRWLRGVFPPLADFVQSRVYDVLNDPFRVYQSLLESEALEFPADVVVAHDLPMLAIGAACARRHGAHLIYDSHELFAEQGFSPSARNRMIAIERELIVHCDAVITVNDSIAAVMAARYALPRVHVILNAAPFHGKRPSGRLHRELGLAPHVRIVLLQGVLSVRRNLRTLVQAAKVLRGRDAVLVFLGDGPEAAALQETARASGVSDLVHLHPRVAQERLLDFTTEAALGVIPYQPDCENNRLCTPNKLFEFIAAGVPVIATDLPELRRFIADMGIGLVGDTSTAETLSALLIEALDDAQRLQSWRARVQDLASTRVNWAIEAARLLSLYESVLGAPARAGARQP